jgi:hypothetical protein
MAILAALPVVCAEPRKTLRCDDSSGRNGRLVRFCEIREQTVAATAAIAIDGRENGGISVKGWDGNNVLVRAKVETAALTDADAKGLASNVSVQTGATIRADGPQQDRDQHWSVSYEVFVPRPTRLSLTTHNGGIHIEDVTGGAEFNAVNGGIHLDNLAGMVQGRTTNGGVHIKLTGDRWQGQGLDVQTTNGGVHIEMPRNYSAQLDFATTNGGVHADVEGGESRPKGRISATVGSGGPTIRAVTTNGGVHVERTS